jgi:hypothetical protein
MQLEALEVAHGELRRPNLLSDHCSINQAGRRNGTMITVRSGSERLPDKSAEMEQARKSYE